MNNFAYIYNLIYKYIIRKHTCNITSKYLPQQIDFPILVGFTLVM